jgi:hypothetical protein
VTKEELCALPASVVSTLLWDHCPGVAAALANVEAPKPPRSPRFDARIYRRDGYQWASVFQREPRNDAPISPSAGRAPAFDDDDITY